MLFELKVDFFLEVYKVLLAESEVGPEGDFINFFSNSLKLFTVVGGEREFPGEVVAADQEPNAIGAQRLRLYVPIVLHVGLEPVDLLR